MLSAKSVNQIVRYRACLLQGRQLVAFMRSVGKAVRAGKTYVRLQTCDFTPRLKFYCMMCDFIIDLSHPQDPVPYVQVRFNQYEPEEDVFNEQTS